MSPVHTRLGLVLGAVGLGAAATACGLGTAPGDWAVPGSEALVRPDTPGNNLQFNFEDTDVVEAYPDAGPDAGGGDFLVHYTRSGPNAVPATDSDGSGVPDFVEQVAAVYAEVLAHYRDELGFRPPVSDEGIADNGGDGRFDVYLVDFGGVGDGNYQNDQCDPQNSEICAGYMIQENDFQGYGYPSTLIANRILASHEFFHAVQAAYDTGQGSVLAEGTAVWATESFDPALHDFEGFLPGYLQNPDRSLDVPMPGPVDPFSYGAAIFFQFLEERYGAGKVRALLERCVDGSNGVAEPGWFAVLDAMLQAEAGVSFADAFVEFASYNLFTSSYADPARSYANGAQYPPLRMQTPAAPYVDPALRVFYASTQYYSLDPADRGSMTAALVVPEGGEADLEGLRMLFVVRSAGAYGPMVEVAAPTAASEVADTASAERFVVAVVNTLQQGQSRRPGLCIGTPDEVESCRSSLLGAGGAAGAGGAGGAAAGGDAPPPGEDEGGCSCRLGAASASARPPHGPGAGSTLMLGLGLGLGALGRLARRRPGQ